MEFLFGRGAVDGVRRSLESRLTLLEEERLPEDVSGRTRLDRCGPMIAGIAVQGDDSRSR